MLRFMILGFIYEYGATLLGLLLFLGVLVLWLDFARFGKPLLDDTVSHWHNTVQGVSINPAEFYNRIKQQIQDWDLPGVDFTNVVLHEGGLISWRRQYLRVYRRGLIYDICLYPFGGGVFVSSWLREPTSILHKIPLLGRLFRALTPRTYYSVDSAICFQEITHAAVLAVLDEYTKTEGVQPIPDDQRKPVMRELYMGNVSFVGSRPPALR
jgi:hypothetical protein